MTARASRRRKSRGCLRSSRGRSLPSVSTTRVTHASSRSRHSRSRSCSSRTERRRRYRACTSLARRREVSCTRMRARRVIARPSRAWPSMQRSRTCRIPSPRLRGCATPRELLRPNLRAKNRAGARCSSLAVYASEIADVNSNAQTVTGMTPPGTRATWPSTWRASRAPEFPHSVARRRHPTGPPRRRHVNRATRSDRDRRRGTAGGSSARPARAAATLRAQCRRLRSLQRSPTCFACTFELDGRTRDPRRRRGAREIARVAVAGHDTLVVRKLTGC